MKTNKESKTFNEGLNRGLSLEKDIQSASKESIELRQPLHSPDISGKDKKGYVPNRIFNAQAKIEELIEIIARIRDERIARELEAGEVSKPWGWFIVLVILVVFDGLLLGPIISNAIHSFRAEYLIYLVGLGVSIIIAAGGYGIGYAVRAVRPEPVGKMIAVVVSAIIGVFVGVGIGWAGDGTLEGTLIRSALTSLSMLAASVFHFIYAEATEKWGSVKVARNQEEQLIAERDNYLSIIDQYEESSIAEREAFNRQEAERKEGLEMGKKGQQRWIRPNITNLVLMLVLLFSMACSSDYGVKSTVIMVVDATDEVSREQLSQRTLKQAQLDYGQHVEAYVLSCNGLKQAYRASVKDISTPKHRQHLKEVNKQLGKTVTEAIMVDDTRCSPIITSLLMLSEEIKLRQRSNERISLIVGSDFELNKDKSKLEQEPFSGLDVKVVLTSSQGKNLKRRKKALTLIDSLFKGANLQITN